MLLRDLFELIDFQKFKKGSHVNFQIFTMCQNNLSGQIIMILESGVILEIFYHSSLNIFLKGANQIVKGKKIVGGEKKTVIIFSENKIG